MTRAFQFDRAQFAPTRPFCGRACACAILVGAALLLAHCGGGSSDGGEVTPDSGASGIGPAGGSVHSQDGLLTLEIPPGALAGNVDITVQPVANTAPGGAGSAYRLLPAGTTFAVPITVRFAITAADLAGTTLDGLGVGYLGDDGVWRWVDAVTRDSSSLSVSTTHFSDWSRLIGWQLRPPSARIGAGETVTVKVVDCEPVEDDGLVGLVPDCVSDDLLTPLNVSGWAVDGIPNGSLSVGQLSVEQAEATYRAPMAMGEETHAVSVRLTPIRPHFPVELLVSEITVVGVEGFHVEGKLDLEAPTGGPCILALSPWVKDGVALDVSKNLEGAWTVSNIVNQPSTWGDPVPIAPVLSVTVTEAPQIFEAVRGEVDPDVGTKMKLAIVATQRSGACIGTLPEGTVEVPATDTGELTVLVTFDTAKASQTVVLPYQGWTFTFTRD